MVAITCCSIRPEFWCGCLDTATARVCILHRPVCANSPAHSATVCLSSLFSSTTTTTQPHKCMRARSHGCAHATPDPALIRMIILSSIITIEGTRLSLGSKLHPLWSPLGRGWERAQGTTTQISHSLITAQFDHLRGQMDYCFQNTTTQCGFNLFRILLNPYFYSFISSGGSSVAPFVVS